MPNIGELLPYQLYSSKLPSYHPTSHKYYFAIVYSHLVNNNGHNSSHNSSHNDTNYKSNYNNDARNRATIRKRTIIYKDRNEDEEQEDDTTVKEILGQNKAQSYLYFVVIFSCKHYCEVSKKFLKVLAAGLVILGGCKGGSQLCM
jgi:hypothetical protein